MQTQSLYLPMLIGLWGTFLGIVLIIIGFVDKKRSFTQGGWSLLIANGLISLFFNLFQIRLSEFASDAALLESAKLLRATGWLNLAGASIALAALFFYRIKSRRYLLLAVLAILFFSVLFFQYYGLIQKPK